MKQDTLNLNKYNGGIFSGYQSLLVLYLSGTPSLRTGTSPPSCLYLDNHLYMTFNLSQAKYSYCLHNGPSISHHIYFALLFVVKTKKLKTNRKITKDNVNIF